MRARPWVVSLAVHGAVLAWLAAGRSEAPRRALAPALARAPAATPAPEPIELTWVTVLDDPAPAPREAGPAIAAPAIPRDRRPRRAARRPAPASAAPPESPPPASPPPASPPPASPPPPPRATLSMRRPGDVEPPRIARPGSDGISDEALEAMVNGELPVRSRTCPARRPTPTTRGRARGCATRAGSRPRRRSRSPRRGSSASPRSRRGRRPSWSRSGTARTRPTTRRRSARA